MVNDPQALFVNPGCLKCISGINLYPAIKKMFTISFFQYLVLTCLMLLNNLGPTKGILLKGVFIPKLLNNPLASCCLINFDYLLSHTAHFDKSNNKKGIQISLELHKLFCAFYLSIHFALFLQLNNFLLRLYFLI